MKISNLFQKENSALQKLQSALEKNHQDEQWLGSLRAEADRLRQDRASALAALVENPSDAAVQSFVAADSAAALHAQAFIEAGQASHRVIHERAFERTKTPLLAALAEGLLHLRLEIERVAQEDQKSANSLGLLPDDCRSPVRHRLANEISRGEKILAEVHLATEIGHLKNGLKFLGK